MSGLRHFVVAVAGLALLLALEAATAQEVPEPPPPEPLLLPSEEPAMEAVPSADRDPLKEAEGPRIVALEVRSDAPMSRRDVASYVTLAVGDPLTEDAVRRTLTNLYATGLAARAAVYTRPAAEGVEVVLALWANVIVEQVRLEGPWKEIDLRREELEDVLAIREGDLLIESRILRSDFRLEERLEEWGYRDARVGLQVDVDPDRRRATVTFEIEPGPRWQIGALLFEGDLGPLSRERLLEESPLAPGDPYRRQATRRVAERLQQFLIDQKYRTATVESPRETFREDALRVDLIYPVQVGPKLEFEVEGADISRLRKKGLLPFLTGEGYDEALLLQAQDRIRTFFQRQGYYQVAVTHREEPIPEGRRIVIEVDKGPVLSLAQLRFEGNEAVSEATLRELMETSEDVMLGLGRGRLVSEVLAEDLSNIRSYYALHGFRGTGVGPEEAEIRDEQIFLTVPIEEGTQRTVSELAFQGMESLSREEVLDRFELAEGGPFHPSLLEDSLDNLRSLYESRGYVNAQVSAGQTWNEERTEVVVEVRVLEGTQQVLDRILIRGNRRTADFVIRHALEAEPGEPVSRSKLLQMERNLYRLGIFSRVRVELTPADLGTRQRDVVVQVEEGRTRSLSVGLGWELDSGESEEGRKNDDGGPRVSVGYTQRNVFGRGYRFLADGRLEENEERFRIVFEQPYIRLLPVGMLYEAFLVQEDRESFDGQRWIGRVETFREQGAARLSLAFDYRLLEADNLAEGFLIREDLPEDSEDEPKVLGVRPGVLSVLEEDPDDPDDPSVQMASLLPGLFVDHRDDPVDPTEGWSLSAQLQYAFPLAGAEVELAELFVQETHYVPLGEWGVFASSVRLGAIEPLRSVPGSDRDPGLAIPLDERFFAGGRTTHRAFDRFELGIAGDELTGEETLLGAPPKALPVGGNGLALVNLEYRFPIFGPVGGTVFTDWGQVWRDWRDFDPDELRPGAGVGARYQSPIGPLRLDVGFKLDRREGEPRFRINFVFGNPF